MRSLKPIILVLMMALGLTVALARITLAAPHTQKQHRTRPVVRNVTVITDSRLDAPARYGIGKLIDALHTKGIAVSQGRDNLRGSGLVILAGLGAGSGPAAN